MFSTPSRTDVLIDEVKSLCGRSAALRNESDRLLAEAGRIEQEVSELLRKLVKTIETESQAGEVAHPVAPAETNAVECRGDVTLAG